MLFVLCILRQHASALGLCPGKQSVHFVLDCVRLGILWERCNGPRWGRTLGPNDWLGYP